MSIIDRAARRLAELQGHVAPLPNPIPVRDGRPSASVGRIHSDLTLVEPRRPDAPVTVNQDVEPTVAGTIALDLPRLEKAGYLCAGTTRSVLGEELRRLKRPLLHAWHQNPSAGSILVTSSIPGEGKTFFALNLAMSLATEINLHVLLVDADVAHREVMRRLGVGDGAPGLLDLLGNPNMDGGDAILKSNLPKLEILPAGIQRTTANEWLASDSMSRTMSMLLARRKNQVVVLDGPPLLVTTEAQVLATRAGQVVMVVASGSTPKNLVGQALESLEPCPMVSMVLNKSTEPKVSHGYGYY